MVQTVLYDFLSPDLNREVLSKQCESTESSLHPLSGNDKKLENSEEKKAGNLQ